MTINILISHVLQGAILFYYFKCTIYAIIKCRYSRFLSVKLIKYNYIVSYNLINMMPRKHAIQSYWSLQTQTLFKHGINLKKVILHAKNTPLPAVPEQYCRFQFCSIRFLEYQALYSWRNPHYSCRKCIHFSQMLVA